MINKQIMVVQKKGWTRKKVVALASCCAVLGGAFGGCWSYLFLHNQGQENVQDMPISTVMEGIREKSVLNVTYIDTSREMTSAEVRI